MNIVTKMILALSISSAVMAQQPEGTYPCGEHLGETIYCSDKVGGYYLQSKNSLLGLVSSGTGGFPGVVYEGVMCSSNFSDPTLKCPTGNTPWYYGPGLIATGDKTVDVTARVHFDIKPFCMNSLALCQQVLAGEHMRFELLVNGKVVNRPIYVRGWSAFNATPNGIGGFDFDLVNPISTENPNFHKVTLEGINIPANSKIDVRISNTNRASTSYYLHAVEIIFHSRIQ